MAIILSKLKTVDFAFFIFLDLRLGVSIILHITVTNCYMSHGIS